MNKKVLVTGASGFLGRSCIKFLTQQNFEIHAISRKNIKDKKINWHICDLFESNSVYELIKNIRPSYLLHAAWTTEHGEFWSTNENIMWLSKSLELLKNFLEFGGKRIVMIGSCAEYNWNYGRCSELDTPLDPNSLYGVCKNHLQQISNFYANNSDASFAWARLFYLFGPYENKKKFISSTINSLLKNKTTVCNNSNFIRDFLHIDDAASALVKLLLSDIKGPINIASGNEITLGEIIHLIAKYLNKTNLVKLNTSDFDHDNNYIVADITRLKKELSWIHKINFGNRLIQTIEWWQEYNETNPKNLY